MLSASISYVSHGNHSKIPTALITVPVPTLEPGQLSFRADSHYFDTPLHSGLPDPDLQAPLPDTMQERLQMFLLKNLREPVTLKELSRFLGYSQKYCSEFFRLQMGVCFSHYLKRLRIVKATRMLGNRNLPISRIAELLGFSDSFAFSHFFKRAVGCSPTEFRKQQMVQVGFQ